MIYLVIYLIIIIITNITFIDESLIIAFSIIHNQNNYLPSVCLG